jgi:predicted translin family RNA/ssDNA-binding protein
MLEIDFDKLNETFSSSDEIKHQIDNNKEGFKFRKKIYRAKFYSDLAQDYLEAAYIGEQLCQFAERINLSGESNYMYDSIIELTLKPKTENIEELSRLIYKYCRVCSGEDQDLNLEFIEELNEYRDNLEQISHTFPELVDDYYANFINGEYYEYDPKENKDFFDKEFSLFPERKHGFNKSAYSNIIKQDFYASIDSLIIPHDSDFNLILKKYLGIQTIDFIKADFLAIGNITYLISEGLIVHFPFDSFIKAKHCAGEALEAEKEIYRDSGRWMQGFLTYHRWIAKYNEKENLRGYPYDLSEEILRKESQDMFVNPSVVCFYLSSYGDHILVKDDKYSYFFFGTDKLNHKELGFLGNKLSLLFNATANLAGIQIEINCPWEQLNNETFEEVCFDIIYHNPKFDNYTIRKMGKAKSRDGGRDIVVFTNSRPGKPAQKFIFQCKYQQPGSSLSGSRVQDISDTITQYGASGYGIMTNVVIDSTLYDKMDGIRKTLSVEIEDYSVYQLERILAYYPQIKQRHFKAIIQTENN